MAFDDYLGAERARLNTQAPQAPAYQFRDDRNAALANDASVQAAGIKANPLGGATAPGTAADASGAFAPAKTPDTGFAGFTHDLEAGAPTAAKPSGSNPFAPVDAKASVNGAISRLLQHPTGGFDQQAAIGRENAVKSNQVANQGLQQQAALQFLPGTGQSFAPAQQQTDQQLLAMRSLDATNAAGHAQAEQSGLQAGIQAGQAQQGLENTTAAQAEAKRQFNESLALNTATSHSAADVAQGNLGVSQGQLDLSKSLGQGQLAVSQGQLALNTTLGLGDLSVREKSLAQTASQASDQLSFQKTALAQGFTAQEAQRAWQATQNDKDRANQTAQFYDTLGLSKEKLAFDKEIGLGNLSLEQTKVANQASQFTTQEDFQKYALNAGLDQKTAELAWQSNENEAQRKFTSGERLSSEEFTTLVNKSQQDFQASQTSLASTLQLTVQGNQQKFEAAQTAAAQAYDKAKTEAGMSHEDALAASTQAFQKQMQAAGFTNDQIMQATQLTQQGNIAKQQMDLQETMHMADLASSDKQFGAKMGLDYAQLNQQSSEFNATMAKQSDQFAQTFGLNKAQVDAALKSDAFQAAVSQAQIGMQLTANNPDAMKPFAEQMARTMGQALGLSQDQIDAGIKSGALTSATSGTAPAGPGTVKPPTDNVVQASTDFVSSLTGKLKSGTDIGALTASIKQLGDKIAANPDDYASTSTKGQIGIGFTDIMNVMGSMQKAGMSQASARKALPFVPQDQFDRVVNSLNTWTGGV